jgi:hypothetical protein
MGQVSIAEIIKETRPVCGPSFYRKIDNLPLKIGEVSSRKMA